MPTPQEISMAKLNKIINTYDDVCCIIKVESPSMTLGDIATTLNTVNTNGDHVFFDLSSLGVMMYLCTIFIDTANNVYKVFDLVSGRYAEGTYNATTLLTMATAQANGIAVQSQIDHLQSEIDELGGKSVLENWDVLGDMIQAGTSTSIIDAGDMISVHWIKSVLGTTTNGLTVACSDMDKFITGVGEAEASTYLFVFDGANWTYKSAAVTLSNFGLSVSGAPQTGEVMTIVTTVDSVDYTFTSYDTVSPVDNTVAHNWLMEQTYAPDTKAWDTYESLFCIKSGRTLPAGKYYLPLYSYRSSKTFNCCLTLGSDMSGKMQFARNASGSASIVDNTGATISGVYAASSVLPVTFGTTTAAGSAISVTYLSDDDVTSGGYTLLSADDVTYGNFDCVALGNNTWEYSNIRSWLNDDSLSDSWTPAHDNDLASSYNRGKGFLYGIDPRVKALIQTAEVQWTAGYGNTADFTRNQVYTSQDNVFLLSMKEMGFSSINTGEGAGTQLYLSYSSGTPTDSAVASRAKYNKAGGTLNTYRWSRSASSSYADYSRRVASAGAYGNGFCYGAYFFAPAFIIGKSA